MLRWDAVNDIWEAVDAYGDVPTLFAFGSADLGWGIRFDTGEEGVVVGWQLLGLWTAAGPGPTPEWTSPRSPRRSAARRRHAVVATEAGSVVTVGR